MSESFSRPVLLAILALACGEPRQGAPTAPAEYPFAWARSDCAPLDGPAVSVFLTREPTTSDDVPVPRIWISIWRGLAEVKAHRFTLAASNSRVGAASLCLDWDDCEPLAGWVRFGRSAPDGALKGEYELWTTTGRRLAGRFTAEWRERTAFCG
jgi:hypothetical protein